MGRNFLFRPSIYKKLFYQEFLSSSIQVAGSPQPWNLTEVSEWVLYASSVKFLPIRATDQSPASYVIVASRSS